MVSLDPIALEARAVDFAYRGPLISGFSLQLRPNEVVGVIGPNGCGKTTVLKLLDGILSPSSGEVLININGRQSLALLSRKEIARRIAMVPQNGGLPGHQTVFHFALQGRSPHLSLLGFESAHDEEITREALRLTHLEEYADALVSEISGGEKQRLLLARALTQQPAILLLDEFTANLDVNYQVELVSLVVRITRERRLATLVVSHEINILAAFCDRIILISDGAILRQGSPSEVLTEANLLQLFGISFTVRQGNNQAPEVMPVIRGN
jgi:iron complex transport system ATP-binding protein